MGNSGTKQNAKNILEDNTCTNFDETDVDVDIIDGSSEREDDILHLDSGRFDEKEADSTGNFQNEGNDMWEIIKTGLAENKTPTEIRKDLPCVKKRSMKWRRKKDSNCTDNSTTETLVKSFSWKTNHKPTEKDEFTREIEKKVNAFFNENRYWVKNKWLNYVGEDSSLYAIPSLLKIHQRHRTLRQHSCCRKFGLRNQLVNDKVSQTDFKRETWIHEKTTVKRGNDFVNVVSAVLEEEKLQKQKQLVKTIENQNTLIRCAVYSVLGKIGFAEFLKHKLKKACPDASESYGKKKVMDVCRERIEWYREQFIENFGPLPLDENKFNKIMNDFVTLIESSFKDKLSVENDYVNQTTEKKNISDSDSTKSSDESYKETTSTTSEKNLDGTEEQLSDWDEPLLSTSSSSYDTDDDSWHDVKCRGDGPTTNYCDDSSDENLMSATKHARKACNPPTTNVISNARMFREIFESSDASPAGSFDCGTYRADGEVLVEKCKRGSRKKVEVKPKKVKTRGVPNKHLRQSSEVVEPANSGFIDLQTESYVADKTEAASGTCGEVKSDVFNSSVGSYDPADRIIIFDDDVNENAADQRHLIEMPTQIIQGKKKDCDLLEEKYSSRQNKKRQKDDRKKRQRARSKLTTIQFGLNANNCADDPELWSNDEEAEYNQPKIMYSSGPLQDEEDSTDQLIFPALTYFYDLSS